MKDRTRKKFKDIQWSNKSVVHNLFRVFEWVFGRKNGIRLESRTSYADGLVFREFHTVEALLVYKEARLLEFLKKPRSFINSMQRVRVYRPALVNPGGTLQPIGYTFAIAEDSTTGAAVGSTGSSPHTFSHTVAGTDRALLVSVHWSTGTSTASATYNGTSMTNEVQKDDGFNTREAGILSLIAPDTGANDVVVTYGSGADEFFVASSFTGVDQTDCVEATNSVASGYSTSYPKTISVTTLTDNAWAVGAITDRENGCTGADTGSVDLYFKDGGTGTVTVTGGLAYKTTTSAGSTTVGWTGSGNNRYVAVIVSLVPAPAGGETENAIFAFGGM